MGDPMGGGSEEPDPLDTPAEDSPTTEGLPPVLTVEEVAKLLRVNRNTAYQALARGDIPGARRIGRTIRVGRDTVLEWLRGQGRVSRRTKCP